MAAVLVLGMAFAGGYRYAAALYVRDIAALREDYAEQARIMEEKYRASEQPKSRRKPSRKLFRNEFSNKNSVKLTDFFVYFNGVRMI